MTVTLRPQTPHDEDFLRSLIVETVAGELGASAWPEPMRGQVLELQYKVRRESSRTNIPETANCIIRADGADAGWVVVTTLPDSVTLMEIMILPKLRGNGIGTSVIRGILSGAAETGKPVRLHVNITNHDAIRLYERCGFRRIDGNEMQHRMEYLPHSSSAKNC